MTTVRVRREPPSFRRVQVRRTEELSAYMVRVVLGGESLEGFELGDPAASIRLLVPSDGDVVIPKWDGNLFLNADGSRASIRTLTPRRFDPVAQELDLDLVVHDNGLASAWAVSAQPGEWAAVSGPGRGYSIDAEATAFLLVGDETAMPAICQLLEYLPDVPITVHISVRFPDARIDLDRDVDVTWHIATDGTDSPDSLVTAIRSVDLPFGVRIWAAGEASSMHRIRKLLFDERSFPRKHAIVRGYWRHR